MKTVIVTTTNLENEIKDIRALEAKIAELTEQLKVADSKARIKVSKSDILKFINKAIRKEPDQMVKLLVKRILLYNDRIEIYYNISEGTRPDEETHQAFSFYTEKFTYENHAWIYTKKGENSTTYDVILFI